MGATRDSVEDAPDSVDEDTTDETPLATQGSMFEQPQWTDMAGSWNGQYAFARVAEQTPPLGGSSDYDPFLL